MKANCPDHGEVELIEEYKKVYTGYIPILRKIMHIGKCPHEGCSRWCEIFFDYIMWA